MLMSTSPLLLLRPTVTRRCGSRSVYSKSRPSSRATAAPFGPPSGLQRPPDADIRRGLDGADRNDNSAQASLSVTFGDNIFVEQRQRKTTANKNNDRQQQQQQQPRWTHDGQNGDCLQSHHAPRVALLSYGSAPLSDIM